LFTFEPGFEDEEQARAAWAVHRDVVMAKDLEHHRLGGETMGVLAF
jgi:hypothetical protein